MPRRLLPIAAMLLAACTTTVTPTTTAATSPGPGTDVVVVDRVIDGDTFEAGPTRHRLDGINAPDQGECLYEEARDRLAEIEGTTVGIRVTGTDQFGRALVFVDAGGSSINHGMVGSGMAIATTPSEDADSTLVDAEQTAWEAGVGIWAPDACGAMGELPEVRILAPVFDPPGRDEEDLEAERVPITNEAPDPVDLSGWVLRDESSVHRFTFDEGTILLPGETITVTSADPGWDPGGSPVWNNDGDLVLLLDGNGRVVDRFRYRAR